MLLLWKILCIAILLFGIFLSTFCIFLTIKTYQKIYVHHLYGYKEFGFLSVLSLVLIGTAIKGLLI